MMGIILIVIILGIWPAWEMIKLVMECCEDFKRRRKIRKSYRNKSI